MLKKYKPKGLTQGNFWSMPRLHGIDANFEPFLKTSRLMNLALTFFTCFSTHADTVYRCGEAYSTSNQCIQEAATEVKPSSVLHTSGPVKSSTTSIDLRDAQALEKQRLQTERQAAQSAPISLSTTNAPKSVITSHELIAQSDKHKGKHARKTQSPYFTAVDPSAKKAKPKKKSTSKGAPTDSGSSQ